MNVLVTTKAVDQVNFIVCYLFACFVGIDTLLIFEHQSQNMASSNFQEAGNFSKPSKNSTEEQKVQKNGLFSA